MIANFSIFHDRMNIHYKVLFIYAQDGKLDQSTNDILLLILFSEFCITYHTQFINLLFINQKMYKASMINIAYR